ncbi:hypothetical protein ALC57_04087, partial [Trachymyrmex cornetzi]
CQKNVDASLNLLLRLGFLVNYAKSQLSPSFTCKYLGFIFNSVRQSVSIPPDRRRGLLSLMLDMSRRPHCSIRDFTSTIGSLISVCPAVQYGLLYIKRFERERFLALGSDYNSYDRRMLIPPYLKEDFYWWIRVTPKQANTIRTDPFMCKIFSDASLTGWGASCGERSTHGWWSSEDSSLHINALELNAAFFALKSLAADRQNCNILLRIDNTTTLAYINNFGSVRYPTLSDIARDIWRWCTNRNIYLFASYIASADNTVADRESRVTNLNTEWSLSTRAFNLLEERFGPFDIDLFASAINAKNELYVSWLPDPGSWEIDPFTLSWINFNFYAFPLFILIPKVLRKIVDERATGVLLVASQPWFPLFVRLLISEPLILPPLLTHYYLPLLGSLTRNGRTFPWRQIIRRSFQSQTAPPVVLDTLIASLSTSTINQYIRPLRD